MSMVSVAIRLKEAKTRNYISVKRK